MHQPCDDNVIPFSGRRCVATNRFYLPEQRRAAADPHDEPDADRLRRVTLTLRRRGWSEDAILLLKVVVTMGGAFLLAYALAFVLNGLGLARFILS